MQPTKKYKSAEYVFFCKDDVSRVSGIKGSNIQEILADGSN